MELIATPLERALATLKEAWAEYQKDTTNTFVRDSVTQRFEYTFELAHKMLRRFLSGTEPSRAEVAELYFNDLIRLGCKRGLLLNDIAIWAKYRELRNLTSHNYDEYNADELVVIIPTFIEEIEYELAKITEKTNQQTVLLHIDENHIHIITSIIKSISALDKCPVYMYGSRVQGKAAQYSDVDLAVDYQGKPVPESVKTELSSQFAKSVLPYSVDIIDLNAVSPVFRAKIEKDFVKIFG